MEKEKADRQKERVENENKEIMEKYQRLKDSIVKENKNNEEIQAMERRR